MHLERVASVRTARITYEDKRRRMLIDLALCFGVPIVYMALCRFIVSMVRTRLNRFSVSDYIVQGHRFDIVQGFGCQAETYVSIPEFFLMRLPPILFSLGTLILSGASFTIVHATISDFEFE